MAIRTPPPGLVESFQPIIGRAVTIRPLQSHDAEIERGFLSGLSEQTRVNRLLGGAIRVTDEYIRRLTDLDWSREAALAAITMFDEAENIIGVARYVRDDEGSECEFAIVVADAWQGCGIGRRMLGSLVRLARAQGLTAMRGDTLAMNRSMIALARSVGFAVSRHPDDATLARLVLRFSQDHATP